MRLLPHALLLSLLFGLALLSCNEQQPGPHTPAQDSTGDTLAQKPAPAVVPPPQPPPVHFHLNNCKLTLSEKAQQALENYAPGFVPWKRSDFAEDCGASDALYKCDSSQAPFAVIGDFNGDSLKDIVISGHSRNYELILCLFAGKDSFRIIEIERNKGVRDPKKRLEHQLDSEVGLQEYLIHASPGHFSNDWDKYPLDLKTDAFEMCYCGKASDLWYYKNGAFHTYTTSD